MEFKGTILGIFLVLMIVILCNSIVFIKTGEIGVVTQFGAVQDRIMTAGINFKAPFVQGVKKMNCKTQELTTDNASSTKDLQDITMNVSVNYCVNVEKASELYKTVGTKYQDIILTPILADTIKTVSAEYTAEETVTKRAELSSKIYEKLNVVEWNGYLVCLVNSKLYLADSRQVFRGTRGYEYEWYYWELNQDFIEKYGKITSVLSVDEDLLIGTSKGFVYILDKSMIVEYTNGTEHSIYSCWQTPYDVFGDTNNLKTTNKRGGVAKIKTIPNGKIKVSVQTNRKEEKFIKEYSATGFDFSNVDFSNFAFTTKNLSYIVYKIKMKKFIDLTLKFYSEREPFGLYDATLEVFKGSYIKRT